MPAIFPQSIKGTRASRWHNHLQIAFRRWRLWFFPPFYFFPTISIFLTASFSNLIAIQSVILATLPQWVKEQWPTAAISTCGSHGEGDDVELASCFYFFPPFHFFLTATFLIKLLFGQLRTVLPQSIKGSRTCCRYTLTWLAYRKWQL